MIRSLAIGVVVLLLDAAPALAIQAQPPAQPAPPGPAAKAPRVRPVFENDRVRVIEVAWEPGAAIAASQLSSEDMGVVGVVIRGGTMEHTFANGKKQRRERRSGEVLWEAPKARIDARQNVGQTNLNVIQVRLLKTAPTRAYAGPVPGAKKVLENARVIAFDHTLAPGAKVPAHKYAPRVWVVLEGGRLRSSDKDGKNQEAHINSSQVVWLHPQEQSLENIGAKPFRVISLELK